MVSIWTFAYIRPLAFVNIFYTYMPTSVKENAPPPHHESSRGAYLCCQGGRLPPPPHYTWVVLDDGEHNYGSEWYRRLIDTTLGCSGI